MSEPLFIPKDQVKPGVEYKGYVATPEGLVHHTRAKTSGHAAKGDARWRNHAARVPQHYFDAQPNIRRTPQQRVESLMRRIVYQYEHYGWSESLLDDLVTLTWNLGSPVPKEELRTMARNKLRPDGKPLTTQDLEVYARAKLERAEKEEQEKQARRVTRMSPYVLSPGSGQQGAGSRNQGGL